MILSESFNINLSKQNFYLTLVWLLFTSVEPFQFYAMVPYHPYKFLALSLTSFFFFIVLKCIKNVKLTLVPAVIIVQLIYTIFTIIIHLVLLDSYILEDSEIYINLSIQFIVIFIAYLFIQTQINFRDLSISFIRVMTWMTILGMLSVLLIYFFNIQPYSYTHRVENRDFSNFILTFSTGKLDDLSSSIIRPSGYFDEPGTFAFYIVVALLLNKIYSFSKLAEKVLLIMGFCTLSLAFIISAFLYLLIFGIIEKKYVFISILCSIIIIFSVVIYNFKEDNIAFKQLYELTIYRLESDGTDDKLINGDNRSENFQYAINAFKEEPLFGYGMNAHVNPRIKYYGKLCCNPMHPLATEGIFGTIIYFLIFFCWTGAIFYAKKNDIISIGCWLIVIVNLIQRPGFLAGPFGYFAFVLLYEATKWKNKNTVS